MHFGWCVVLATIMGAAAGAGCSSGAKASADAALDSNGTLPDGSVLADGDALGSDAPTQASPFATFSPSNVDPKAIAWTGLGDVDLTGECRVFVVLGRIECGSSTFDGKISYSRQVQAGAGAVGVFAMKSLRIAPGASLTVVGNLPLVLVAIEKIEILGTIVASAHKYASIAGGFSGYDRNPSGAGPGGGEPGAAGNYAGGGGSFCGIGGAGAASIDAMPAFAGAKAGAKYGNAQLTPLIGGSSGGGSARASSGGGGGGAVQLVAGQEIAIGGTGVINVSGGGARAGAGGGGSGGAVLLEAPKVSVAGWLAANGGGGGVFAGGSGTQDGMPSSTPAAGDNAATGGSGSAAMVLDGAAGLSISGNTTSGGGGGAGRFRINTADGTAMLADKLSPSVGTACVSLGMLRPPSDGPAATPNATAIGFKPSNVDLTALAAMTVEDMVMTEHCMVDTESGTIECGNSQPLTTKFAFSQVTQAGAGKVGVIYVRSLRIEPGAELEIKGGLPLVVAAPGAIAVHGAISGRAIGQYTIAGGFAATDRNGAGPGAGTAGTSQYHGGGGGAYCGPGGAGASANAEPTAAGGSPAGSPTLVPLVGGSSGGGASDPGGAGGGAIQLISGTSIEIGLGGLIDVAGGGRAGGSGGGSGG
ncbi:MAG: hypothetical protein QOI66_1492, partial [Myxococcales bacterium]|nr:hypothetical protein [Myxococcales bacterium]